VRLSSLRHKAATFNIKPLEIADQEE